VAFTANSVTLTIASVEASSICDTALNGPTGEPLPGKATVTAPDNVSYVLPIPAAFRFDGLGQPLTDADTPAPRTINVVNAESTISVEAVTGYVHD
jgi:hypothetical protein